MSCPNFNLPLQITSVFGDTLGPGDGTFSGDFSLPDRPNPSDGTFSGDFSLPDRPNPSDGTFSGDFSLPDRPDDQVWNASGGFDEKPFQGVSGDSGAALQRPNVTWSSPETLQHLEQMKMTYSVSTGPLPRPDDFQDPVDFNVDPVHNVFGDISTSFDNADGSGGGGSIVFGARPPPTFSGNDAMLEELFVSVGLPPLPSLDDVVSNQEKERILNLLLGLLESASQPWMNPDAPSLAAAAIQFGMKDWDESALNLLEGVGTMGKIMADIVRPLGGGKVLDWVDGLIPDRVKEKVLDVVEDGLGFASAVDPTKITSLVQAGIQLGRKDWDRALYSMLSLGFGAVTEQIVKPLKPVMQNALSKLKT